MDFPQNEFWDWTLPTYGRPGVSPACLRLQERHDLDVNLVLYAVWAAANGVELSESDLRGAAEHVSRWHGVVVKGLRSVRVDLKGDPHGAPAELAEAFRDGLKALELASERMEHVILSPLLPDTSVDVDLAERHRMAERAVERYVCMHDAAGPDEGDRLAIATIVSAGLDPARN
jgi:uncharacterized protein (TIGR02444 family)|tara:strand:- start:2965 stop:3486 length:522 start_codon:yes stop_codon:yes gene_type:complete